MVYDHQLFRLEPKPSASAEKKFSEHVIHDVKDSSVQQLIKGRKIYVKF